MKQGGLYYTIIAGERDEEATVKHVICFHIFGTASDLVDGCDDTYAVSYLPGYCV